MSIASELGTRLTGYAPLTTLVSARIYNVRGPANPTESSFPMVIFARMGDSPSISLKGKIVEHNAEYQFSCLAYAYDDARAVADAVIAALDGWRGTSCTTIFRSDQDLYDPEAELYHVAVSFTVMHR